MAKAINRPTARIAATGGASRAVNSTNRAAIMLIVQLQVIILA